MDQSIIELKRRLFAAIRRMRQSKSHPSLPEGITPAEAFVLMAVSRLTTDGKRARSGDVAKCAHSTPRHRDESDSRGITVCLTDLGLRYERMNRRMHDRRLEELLEFLGEDDARELVRIAERLSDFESSHPWNSVPGEAGESEVPPLHAAGNRKAAASDKAGEGGARCE